MDDRELPRAQDRLAPDRTVALPLAVRSWGESDAPGVVFLHGLGLLGPHVSDESAATWAARGFRVLAPELPGFGGSAAVSTDEYRPSRLARLLLDELPERFALVGFSWGATIGCHMVAQARERVTALGLVDAGYQTPPDDPAPYGERLERARAEGKDMRFADAGAFLAAARAHFADRISDAQLLASMRDDAGSLVPQLTPEVYAAAMHGVETEPPQELLGALCEAGLPVLLLVAGQPPSDSRQAEVDAFAQAVPQTEVRHYPEAGHQVLLDAADVAIDDVSDWLSALVAK